MRREDGKAGVCEDGGRIVMDNELTDLSPMPFGKYGPPPKGNGSLMQDVPASYLFWLWANGKQNDKACPVANYIRKNLGALKKEHPDGIW